MRNNYCLIWELSYGFWGNFSCVFGAQKWWPYSGMGVHNLNCCCLSSIGSVAIKQQFADLETKFNSILHTISKLLLKSAHNLQQQQSWKNFYSSSVSSRLGSFFLTGKSWGCASVINRKLFPSLIKISWIYELKTGGKKIGHVIFAVVTSVACASRSKLAKWNYSKNNDSREVCNYPSFFRVSSKFIMLRWLMSKFFFALIIL